MQNQRYLEVSLLQECKVWMNWMIYCKMITNISSKLNWMELLLNLLDVIIEIMIILLKLHAIIVAGTQVKW